VDEFCFPIDLLSLRCSQHNLTQIPIILGRALLATNTSINCRSGAMDISFGNKKVKLNIFNASQESSREEDCYAIPLIEENVEERLSFLLTKDPLQSCLTHFDINEFGGDSYTQDVNALLDSPNSTILPAWTIKYEALSNLAKEPMLPSYEARTLQSKYRVRVDHVSDTDTSPTRIDHSNVVSNFIQS